ncbi:MAG: hypothetical protein A3I66_11830 [Burkholderiales bacterium RIFCSPLOWO2_02_FULL_57_36]|nr:MAG: hypothetical protein A3I66_11830 [Burkholderiales bacterium RIFCSPLOWO2_02_FULL_57_36]
MDWVFIALGSITFIVSLIAWLGLTVRIWKTSPAGAVFSFFLGLPSLYFLFKYWGDEERDIRAPFFTNLGLSVLYLLFVFTVPTYKEGYSSDDERAQKLAVAVKSNPEMERWCREKHEAVYSPALGTCVEPDEDQEQENVDDDTDVIAQLENHFLRNGLEVQVLEVDESTPGGQRMANSPELKRMMQFEIKSKTLLPTLVMVGECISPDACSRLASHKNSSDGPFSVASNGSLMFFSFHIIGDEEKIKQAKQLFKSFKAV